MNNQKCKKKKKKEINCWQKFFTFLNACYPKTHIIKAFNSLDSSRSRGRLLKNKETAGL